VGTKEEEGRERKEQEREGERAKYDAFYVRVSTITAII